MSCIDWSFSFYNCQDILIFHLLCRPCSLHRHQSTVCRCYTVNKRHCQFVHSVNHTLSNIFYTSSIFFLISHVVGDWGQIYFECSDSKAGIHIRVHFALCKVEEFGVSLMKYEILFLNRTLLFDKHAIKSMCSISN